LTIADEANPISRNGTTRRLGIRRLLRSVTVAAATSATVGHKAVGLANCISIKSTRAQELQFAARVTGQQISQEIS
jgi:hypothetical protein